VDTELVIDGRYRGPPGSGNGGYASGLMADDQGAPTTVVLRAPIPLDTPLRLRRDPDGVTLETAEGLLIANARAASANAFALAPPAPPGLQDAKAAGGRFPGLKHTFHPVCFTCGVDLADGEGLRAFVGRVGGRQDGLVAGVWIPPADLVDAEGLAKAPVLWAVLDCPGSAAWLIAGEQAGLLGTVTGRVLRRPALGEATVITAWPLERSGRKRLSGTALYAADGELLAEMRQVWITFA
jgi:hypothetical protein